MTSRALAAAGALLALRDPASGRPLGFRSVGGPGHGIWQADGGTCWPQIDGVVFLRAGRESLADAATRALLQDDPLAACAHLLTDVDDFAPAAPDFEAARAVAKALPAGFIAPREAMQQLRYGPVADYFGLRASTPTFLSGVGLLAEHVDVAQPLVEIACGAGHFLYHAKSHGLACVGVDVTFSKLWLARQALVGSGVPLVCADLTAGAVLPLELRSSANVFCHDAYYFFPDKPVAAARLQSLAGHAGRVVVGHVHLAGQDHAGIAGTLRDPSGYQAQFHDVICCYDDAAIARSVATGETLSPCTLDELEKAEAMAWVAGTPASNPPLESLREVPGDVLLYANPLLAQDATGRLAPAWPSRAFAQEYAEADYLCGRPELGVDALPRAARDLSSTIWRTRQALPAAYLRFAVTPVRWAVIGCGWVARDYVVPGFAETPSARLVAVHDVDAAKRARCQAAAPYDVSAFDSLEAMLAESAPDCVYIATPNDSHAAIAASAAAAGCHVYCEKPLATTPADVHAMHAACATHGRRLATAFDQRFHEAHHVLRAAIVANQLGQITQARVHYACLVDDAWLASPEDQDNWRLDRQRAGGGAAIDLAPHAIDLLAFVLGAEPVAIDAVLQPRLGGSKRTVHSASGASVDAGALLSVRFDSGCLASIHVSYQCPEYLPRRSLELIGTAGGALADCTMGQTPGGRIEWRFADRTETQTFDTSAGLSPFARQIEAFSAALCAGRSWPYAIERDIAHFECLHAALARAEPREDSA